MDTNTLAGIIGSAAFVTALLQVLKTYIPAIGSNTRYLPIVSMLLTDVGGIASAAILGNLTTLAVASVVVGSFMASGFYATAKAVIVSPPATPTPVQPATPAPPAV